MTGMFAHFLNVYQSFQKIIRFLTSIKSFPLAPELILMFDSLKQDVANSAVSSVKENVPFQVETDAYD